MCGIFGFMLMTPQRIAPAFEVLKTLEMHQYPNEENPVGGHGAGVFFKDANRKETFMKVGKASESPAKILAQKVLAVQSQASLFIGHVRRASPEFLHTVSFRESTQPYVASCGANLRVAAVHNGFVSNYLEIRKKLGLKHFFESEKDNELIDSEIIPHFLEELLLDGADGDEALNMLLGQLENQNNAICLLVLNSRRVGSRIVFLHTGKTRGLTVWSNGKGEVMFSSRKEPVKYAYGEFLEKHDFDEKLSIGWNELTNIKPLIFPMLKGAE
jgi:glucosamine 6-phosphate synthetase-like amidotransferase/phosphosugar isomerase protein